MSMPVAVHVDMWCVFVLPLRAYVLVNLHSCSGILH